MVTLPKRLENRPAADKIIRTINDLIGYTAALPTGSYLPLAGGTLTGDLLFSADNTKDIGASGATRPRDVFVARNITVSGGVGIGATAGTALTISETQTGNYVAIITQVGVAVGDKGVQVRQGSTAATDAILELRSNNVARFGVNGDGSIVGKGAEAIQKIPQVAVGSVDLTLGLAYTAFSPSISVSLTPGYWTVEMVAMLTCNNGAGVDVGSNAFATLAVLSGTATLNPAAFAIDARVLFVTNGCFYSVTRSWRVLVTSTAVVEIRAAKSGGTGASVASAAFSTLVASYQGNV